MWVIWKLYVCLTSHFFLAPDVFSPCSLQITDRNDIQNYMNENQVVETRISLEPLECPFALRHTPYIPWVGAFVKMWKFVCCRVYGMGGTCVLMCVSVCVVEGVHKGLGEALQCIILLHLLYSSSPGNRERQRRGCSVGTGDMTAVALLFHSLALAVLLPNALFDVLQITAPFLLSLNFSLLFIELLIISHFQFHIIFHWNLILWRRDCICGGER